MLASLAVVAAGAAHEAKKTGLPQLNVQDFAPQLIWLAITFTVLYLILSRFALPRIGEVIEERKDRIQRDLDSAEKLRRETERALASYEQALADARAKANGIAKETRDKLAAEVDQERHRVESEVAAKVAAAEARIAATKAKALESVNEIAAGTAGAVVEQLIGETVGADEIAKALASAGK